MAFTHINFRATSGYVSDAGGDTYSLGEAYPTTRGGQTFGFSTNKTADARDRTTTRDARLAGIVFHDNASTVDFTWDLPSGPGTYRLRLAAGDFDAGRPTQIVVKDGGTTLATLDASTSIGDQFSDTTLVDRTGTAWPADNVTAEYTFSGSTLVLTIGFNSGVGNVSAIACVGLEATAVPPTATGSFTLADFAFSGTLASAPASSLLGSLTLDDFVLSGTLGLTPGRVDTPPFKNWTGTLLPGITVPNVVFLKLDRTTALSLANQITAGDAVMTVENAALVTGTPYVMVTFNADGTVAGAQRVVAA